MVEENTKVYYYDQDDPNFYIILKGSVSVKIPDPKIKNWRGQRFDYFKK